MRSAPAIGFEYRPSRLLTGAAAALAAFAMLAIALSGAPPWMKIGLEVSTVLYGAFALRSHLRPRVHALNWRSDGSVSITLTASRGAGPEVQGELREARVLGPLIALHLCWPHGSVGLWLLPDNLDGDTRRRLRVRLALDGPHPSVNADSV